MPNPQCEQFEPPWGRQFACMHQSAAIGGVPIAGCAPHCIPMAASRDYPLAIGQDFHSVRWLRPYPGRIDSAGQYRPEESRDGRGNYFFLMSGDPRIHAHWMPTWSVQQIANCWKVCLPAGTVWPGLPPDPATSERFDATTWQNPWTLCDCDAGDTECPGSAEYGHACGWLANCSVFETHGLPPWGPWAGHFSCEGGASGNAPRKVRFYHGSAVWGPAIVSTGGGEARDNRNPATHNWMAHCAGYLVGDEGTGCQPDGFETDGYYNDEVANGWTAFDFLELRRLGPTVSDPEGGAYFVGTGAEATLANLVMSWLQADLELGGAGVCVIDQIDSNRRYAGLDTDTNRGLTLYSAGWTGGVYDGLPTVATLHARLPRYGLAFDVDLVLRSVGLMVSFVAHGGAQMPMDPPFDSQDMHRVFPLMMAELEVGLGIRVPAGAGFPFTHPRPWRPDLADQVIAMSNNWNGWGRPRVTVDGVAIEQPVTYSLDGVPIDPPHELHWRGTEGFLTDPPTADIYDHPEQWSGFSCCRLKWGFNGGQFPSVPGHALHAMQSHPDAPIGERKLIWGGHVQLAMGTSNTPC